LPNRAADRLKKVGPSPKEIVDGRFFSGNAKKNA
jgi:hypothetical protein